MTGKKRNQIISLFILTCIMVFGYASSAHAQETTTAPNPGGPITIDGITTDWDLTEDYVTDLPREHSDPVVVEANIYMRLDYDTNILYILLLTTNPTPNLVTTSQDANYVKIDGVIQTSGNFAFVNQTGIYADGWEASFPITLGSHALEISSNFDHNVWLRGKLRTTVNIYSFDYGDLPDSYGTYITSNGPRHFTGALRLGSVADGEPDGQPGTAPITDDLTARNDEDGVITIGNWRNATPTIQYTVNGCTGTCYLSAWIDWGAFDEASGSWQPDGSFDVISDTLFINQPVVNGTHTFTFSVPSNVGFAATFNTRFRLCDTVTGCATPNSLSPTDAPLGEVEDYQWSFAPNAVTINSFTAVPTRNTTVLMIAAGSLISFLLFGGIAQINRRKKQESLS